LENPYTKGVSTADKAQNRSPKWRILRKYKGLNITGGQSSITVNGDIAIRWEWSNFDHSWNSNPLTDYDQTLHN